jgi:hypothetical protein
VRFCVGEGITQFLDIGSGLPTNQNVHEVAQLVSPQSCVVYVDIDPAVVIHAQAMLSSSRSPGHSKLTRTRRHDGIRVHPR